MPGRAGLAALALVAALCAGPDESVALMVRRATHVSSQGIEEVAVIASRLLAADNLPQDVARSILACWHAPQEGDEITLRMSFRRDGSVFGKPRITYMKAAGGPDGQAELATSAFAAIAACTPLRFTPSLGAAIAGRVFLIRFIAMRKEQRAAL